MKLLWKRVCVNKNHYRESLRWLKGEVIIQWKELLVVLFDKKMDNILHDGAIYERGDASKYIKKYWDVKNRCLFFLNDTKYLDVLPTKKLEKWKIC